MAPTVAIHLKKPTDFDAANQRNIFRVKQSSQRITLPCLSMAVNQFVDQQIRVLYRSYSTRGSGWNPRDPRFIPYPSIVPEPIDFLSPDFSKGLPAIMLRHTYDGELAFSTVIGLVLRKYLPFRTLAKREEGYWISLHSCFASRARLKFLRSLNPKPPFSMGIQIFFHAIQCNPRLFCFVLHQNLAIALVSFLIVSYGKRKHNIT